MRGARTALVSSVLLLGQSAQADAGSPPGPTSRFADGAGQAPAGPAPLPRLLAGYAARPPWAVAGVDYAVGVPLGTSLKDPATISAPGVSLDAGRGVVFIDGDGVILDGYDFAHAPGWAVYVQPGATKTVIRDSLFRAHGDQPSIHAARGAGDLTVRSCTLDGGGGADGAIWALIDYSGSGMFIAEYNLLTNAPADAIDFNAGVMTTIVRYNLFQNLGTAPGSHPDSVQYVGVRANNSVIDFNTVYQPHPGGMQGIQIDAQLSSTLTDTLVRNNTILAPGPEIDMSYLVAVGQTADSRIDGAVVADNVLDVRGAYGAFYPPSGRRLGFIDNVDARSGRPAAAPVGTSASDVVGISIQPPGPHAAGTPITLTLELDRPALVTGIPALALGSGGPASYTGGTGTRTLTFAYAAERADAPPAVISLAPRDGTRITDDNGNPLRLSGDVRR